MTATAVSPDIKVNIRPAIPSDGAQLEHMCGDLLASQDIGVATDVKSLQSTFEALLKNPNCGVWVAVHDNKILGVIAGILTQPLWNATERVAKLLFWYVKPRFFEKLAPHLLRVFETWAKQHQANCIMATTLANRSSTHMVDFFNSHEYETVEYLFAKKI